LVGFDVNAVTVSANEALQGGGGQDHVVHTLAGNSLRKETATFPDDGVEYYGGLRVRCKTGQVVISHGHNLKQPYIIHLVCPLFFDDDSTNLYAKCISGVLRCIDGVKIRSVAIAVFGTGYYGYPCLVASVIIMKVLREWMEEENNRAKCDAIYICDTCGSCEALNVLYSLAFPSD